MRLPKKPWLSGVAFLMALGLAACGGGDNRYYYTQSIPSVQSWDGDIAFDPALNSYTITNGPATLFFGIDEAALNAPEYRAFATFPLDTIPLDAWIQSAVLYVRIEDVPFAFTVPTLLDLVVYTPGALSSADYNSAPLTYPGGGDATRGFDIFRSDVGRDVAIDVTSLMAEAQRRGLPEFQVRFLLDFIAASGFVVIDDRPTTFYPPELVVSYSR